MSTRATPNPEHVKRKLRDAGRRASYHAKRMDDAADIWTVIGEQNHVLPLSTPTHVNDVVDRNYDAAKAAAVKYRSSPLGNALTEMVLQYDRWKMTGEYRNR